MKCVQIGNATLFYADCLKILDIIVEVDAVMTDPPYGIAYKSNQRTDKLWSAGENIAGDKTTVVMDEALAMLKRFQCPMLVFGSRKAKQPHGCRQVLIWDKGPALGMGAIDIPWKPSYEEIYVIGRGFVGKRDEGAVIYHPPVHSMAQNGRRHPNEKPVGLLKYRISKMPKGTIIDPFMGSGTTGVAATQLGQPFIGIEIKASFFEIACLRIEAAQRQYRLFK